MLFIVQQKWSIPEHLIGVLSYFCRVLSSFLEHNRTLPLAGDASGNTALIVAQSNKNASGVTKSLTHFAAEAFYITLQDLKRHSLCSSFHHNFVHI